METKETKKILTENMKKREFKEDQGKLPNIGRQIAYHTQLGYEISHKFLEDNKKEIAQAYDNALYEAELNLKIWYFDHYNKSEFANIIDGIKYLINKPINYTSDYAMVSNFLDKFKDVIEHNRDLDEIVKDASQFLLDSETRFSIIVLLSPRFNSIPTKIKINRCKDIYKKAIKKASADEAIQIVSTIKTLFVFYENVNSDSREVVYELAKEFFFFGEDKPYEFY
jgi:hypothetical protein